MAHCDLHKLTVAHGSGMAGWLRKVAVSATTGGCTTGAPYGCARGLLLAVLIGGMAGAAEAVGVPSGQPVTLHEVLVDTVSDEIWLRFRFIAPDVATQNLVQDFEVLAGDMSHLCEDFALSYLTQYELEGDVIVISLSDRATEFGVADPDAIQLFEAYRPVDNACMWEGL